MDRHKKLAYGLGAALLLMLFSAGILLAQGGSAYFAPRVVEKLPATPVSYQAPSSSPGVISIPDLEKRAGFTLRLPPTLPSNCTLNHSSYDAVGGEVALTYWCGIITEKKTGTVEQPLVGPNSVQQVQVNGQPATYVEGAWVKMPGDKEAKWAPDFDHTLVFEHKGILISLSFGNLTKAELIKLAESIP